MKIILYPLIATLVTFSSCSHATLNKQTQLPKQIQQAFKSVHSLAKNSEVRNLFMFNYAYYANGFCKDQDCSTEKIQSEIAIAKTKMGDDFLKYEAQISSYSKSISYLQKFLQKGDLATLSGKRTYTQIVDNKVFITCVDFAKAILGKSIEYGFPQENLKMYVTMIEDGYKKMCPITDGQKPILPRPVVHTLLAYYDNTQWFALNVEDPDAVPIPLGANLPDRLGRLHQFTFPALIAYQKLIYAGSYPASNFINGYPFNWLLSITASGQLDDDPNSAKCE